MFKIKREVLRVAQSGEQRYLSFFVALICEKRDMFAIFLLRYVKLKNTLVVFPLHRNDGHDPDE